MSARTKNHPHPNPPPEGEGTVHSSPDGEEITLLPPQGEGGDGGGCWTRICNVDEIPRLGARVVRRAAGPNVAVFRTAADTVFALADRCPHRGGPLSQGIVYGDRVACPLHNTNVELASGCAVAPDKGRVQSFAVKVDGDVVYVDLAIHADAIHS